MSQSKRQPRRRIHLVSPVLRPMAWSALVTAAVAVAFASPVQARPQLPSAVPDTGARPLPIGSIQLPGQPPVTGPGVALPDTAAGPLAALIQRKETEVLTLGNHLLELEQRQLSMDAERVAAEQELRAARERLAQAQAVADAAAAEALKDAAALPPGAFGTELYELDRLSRINRGEDARDVSGPARAVSRARAAEQAAYERFLAADGQVRQAVTAFAATRATYRQRETELVTLKRQNETQLVAIEREREAAEQQLGSRYLNGDVIDGVADPRALAAVRYALAQLGDPYVWADEGPNSFDCSGLMWAAYRSPGAGYTLPRVSRDQYFATRDRTVPLNALLPGDLLFFASGSDWRTIHHVAMYIGEGRMVHAPSSGEVVKTATVRWSRLYRATRVFGAVPGPAAPVPTVPPANPAPTTPPATTPPATTPPATTPPATTPPATTPPATTPPATTPPATTPPATTPPATTPPPTAPAEPDETTDPPSTPTASPSTTRTPSATGQPSATPPAGETEPEPSASAGEEPEASGSPESDSDG